MLTFNFNLLLKISKNYFSAYNSADSQTIESYENPYYYHRSKNACLGTHWF